MYMYELCDTFAEEPHTGTVQFLSALNNVRCRTYYTSMRLLNVIRLRVHLRLLRLH